jgi:heme A synthase
MAAQHDKQTGSKVEKGALITSVALFAIFIINVILGKINIAYGLNLPHADNVGEFLLLFVACILLIIAALKRETRENMLLTQTKNEVKNGE